jgi:hypothetical protein
MPLLLQRAIGSENRAFTPTAIRNLLINALAAASLTDANGEPLRFSPRFQQNLCHLDFRSHDATC